MESNELFDWSLYGALIRHGRVKAGCRNTGEFSELIERRTRFRISKDVLYRIEQNRQEPTAMQFVSINLALFFEVWPDFHGSIAPCLSKEWAEINSEYRMPKSWLEEDFKKYCDDYDGYVLFTSDDGRECVDVTDLPGVDEDYFGNLFDYAESELEIERTFRYEDGSTKNVLLTGYEEVTRTVDGEVIEYTVYGTYGNLLVCQQ
ncbi:MAG: hypothetical protein VB027_10425 [Gordonibacter sp.]|nr:hypothetical protein [Gordonibacter sp.]